MRPGSRLRLDQSGVDAKVAADEEQPVLAGIVCCGNAALRPVLSSDQDIQPSVMRWAFSTSVRCAVVAGRCIPAAVSQRCKEQTAAVSLCLAAPKLWSSTDARMGMRDVGFDVCKTALALWSVRCRQNCFFPRCGVDVPGARNSQKGKKEKGKIAAGLPIAPVADATRAQQACGPVFEKCGVVRGCHYLPRS